MMVSFPVMNRAPMGDGGPVLVLPGLAASDLSTRPMRHYLRHRGHHVHGWRLGRNEGPTPETVEGVARRLVEVHDHHRGRPVSVVGWSLGGVFAAAMARLVPGLVRRVITLGSPLAVLDDPDVPREILHRRILAVTGERPGPPVPLTSIWSRTDAIVRWESSELDVRTDAPSENIEVIASHLGIGWSAPALYAIADRLALPDGELAAYEPPRLLLPWHPHSGATVAGSAA